MNIHSFNSFQWRPKSHANAAQRANNKFFTIFFFISFNSLKAIKLIIVGPRPNVFGVIRIYIQNTNVLMDEDSNDVTGIVDYL